MTAYIDQTLVGFATLGVPSCIVCGGPSVRVRNGGRHWRVTCSDACFRAHQSEVAAMHAVDRKLRGDTSRRDPFRAYWKARGGKRARQEDGRAAGLAQAAKLSPEERRAIGDHLREARREAPEHFSESVRKGMRRMGAERRSDLTRRSWASRDRDAHRERMSSRQRPDPTLCSKGLHAWVPENLMRVASNGRLTCRPCNRDTMARWQARRDAAKAVTR